jgi:hypothetical protein
MAESDAASESYIRNFIDDMMAAGLDPTLPELRKRAVKDQDRCPAKYPTLDQMFFKLIDAKRAGANGRQ